MKTLWLLLIGAALGTGCNVLEDLGTNPYEAHYFPLNSVVSVPVPSAPITEPEVQQTLMRRHAERVKLHTDGGWDIFGESEFNTSNSASNRQLLKQARAVGAELVVHSWEFDRREQEWVQRREYESGERFTVNGTTIERPEPVTRKYYNYRATFLRRRGE